ncbi:MAG: YciI family protein [Xanthobacteraceae bacterium]
MLFVIHAIDKKGGMPNRAKHYRDHRIHLDEAADYNLDVVTAGSLLADDGETPCGSVFVIDAKDRASVDGFVSSDPYHVNGVWERVEIHGYNKKRGTPIVSQRT